MKMLIVMLFLVNGCTTLWDRDYAMSASHCQVSEKPNIFIKCPVYQIKCAKFGTKRQHFCIREKL